MIKVIRFSKFLSILLFVFHFGWKIIYKNKYISDYHIIILNKQKVEKTLALITEYCSDTNLVVYPEMTLTGFTMESQKIKEKYLSRVMHNLFYII